MLNTQQLSKKLPTAQLFPRDHVLSGFCSGSSGEGGFFSSPPALRLQCTLSSCVQPSFQAAFGAEKFQEESYSPQCELYPAGNIGPETFINSIPRLNCIPVLQKTTIFWRQLFGKTEKYQAH